MQREPTRATMKKQNSGWSTVYSCHQHRRVRANDRRILRHRAVCNYQENRENGEKIDDPPRKFPNDGNYSDWIYHHTDDDGKEWYRVKYTEGPGDCAWMEEKDRNYLARLKREEEFKKNRNAKSDAKTKLSEPEASKEQTLENKPTITATPEKQEPLEIDPKYICPITGQIMVDPVTGPDGHTYEREAIETWLEKKKTSPMTREPMKSKRLTTVQFVKQTITTFIKNHRDRLSQEDVYLPQSWQQTVIDAIVSNDKTALKRAVDRDPMARLLTCPLKQNPLFKNNLQPKPALNALFVAAETHHVDMIRAVASLLGDELETILSQPQPQNYYPAGSQDLLFAAVQENDIDGMQLALRLWAEIDAPDEKGRTVLHIASQNGNKDLVKAILKHCPSIINFPNANHLTPLYLAVKEGQLAVVNTLLSSEDLEVSQELGEWHDSILHAAYHTEHEYRIPMLQGLLSHSPALATKANSKGETVLHFAAFDGNLSVLKLLMQFKCDPMAKSIEGWNTLHYAINGNQLRTVEYLIEDKSVDPRVKTDAGELPIELAEKHKYEKIANYLKKFLKHWEIENISLRLEMRELQQKYTAEQQQFSQKFRSLSENVSTQMERIKELEKQNKLLKQFIVEYSDKNRGELHLQIVRLEKLSNQNAQALKAYDDSKQTKILQSSFFQSKLKKWELKLQDALVAACAAGDIAKVKELITTGAHPLHPNDEGIPPLLAAAGHLKETVVRYLEAEIAKDEKLSIRASLRESCYQAVKAAVVCPFQFTTDMKLSEFCRWVHENPKDFRKYIEAYEPHWLRLLDTFGTASHQPKYLEIYVDASDQEQGRWLYVTAKASSFSSVAITCSGAHSNTCSLARWTPKVVYTSNASDYDIPPMNKKYQRAVKEIVRRSQAASIGSTGTAKEKQRLLEYFSHSAPATVNKGMGI